MLSEGSKVVKVGMEDEADEADGADKAGAEAAVTGASKVARMEDGKESAAMNNARGCIAQSTAAMISLS